MLYPSLSLKNKRISLKKKCLFVNWFASYPRIFIWRTHHALPSKGFKIIKNVKFGSWSARPIRPRRGRNHHVDHANSFCDTGPHFFCIFIRRAATPNTTSHGRTEDLWIPTQVLMGCIKWLIFVKLSRIYGLHNYWYNIILFPVH